MIMTSLNKELKERLDKLSPRNNELLESFLTDISNAENDVEKNDAVTRLRTRVREIVAKDE